MKFKRKRFAQEWANQRGQVTIFIIIAIIIVGGIILFFTLSRPISVEKLPASIEPVYATLLTCIEQDTELGADILASQAGYITLPQFDSGNYYMPFSNQLDFAGSGVPYWYYVSGNNIPTEQIPSREKMEQELADFIEGRINKCIFDGYYDAGYLISLKEAEAEVDIKENNIEVNLDMDFSVDFADDSALVSDHKIIINSKLGKLYNSALKVYEKEQDELFLENYGMDILRLYAPVDGTELTCSPLVWNADEVFDELELAIEANTLALKSKGAEEDYFVVDLGVEEDVRFINSRNWARSFEVAPNEGNILMASPVGNQAGLGILGFCYVNYHFIYDIKYPVLVQIQDGEEVFQFPVAIVIQGNNPREALNTDAISLQGIPELCKYENTVIEVNVYDEDYNRIDAEISYECAGTKCNLGETVSGFLSEEFPQCVNGYVLANVEGYESGRVLYSSVEPGSVDVFLKKLYPVEVNLKVDSRDYGSDAIISFISEDKTQTIIYPQQTSVELSEGEYEIQVYIYDEASLRIAETTSKQCVEVPKSGIGGILGLTDEKCFEINMPAQIISNVLSGGGKHISYFVESELTSGNLVINADSLPKPSSIEQLQQNYILFEDKNLDVYFT